jgi:hypothetical protein
VWEAIAYVSSGVSLVAFLAAVAAWTFKTKSEERERLIRTASETDRAALVSDALEFFHVETAGLTREQQFKLALEQIRARAERFRLSAAAICFVAVIAAVLAAFAIRLRAQEISPLSAAGPTAQQYAEVIRLRVEDLSRTTNNLADLLGQIKAGRIDQPGSLNRVNDLNNNLVDLWTKIAGYGLGTDPYLENIAVSASGFMRAHVAPDYGISAVPQTMGIPRLYERYLELSKQDSQLKKTNERTFALTVQDYANPSIYPHKDFYERAYSQYRNGNDIPSAQFTSDLDHLQLWLNTLASNLDKLKQLLPLQEH